MSLAGSLRTFFVVLLVAAQPVTASLAAQIAARGGPCPVHAALAAQERHEAMHHEATHHEATHHGATHPGHAGHMPSADHSDEYGTSPADLNFACCAAHALGIPVSAMPLLQLPWKLAPHVAVERGLVSHTRPGADPPPRISL